MWAITIFLLADVAQSSYINDPVQNSLRLPETWENCVNSRVIVGGDPIDIKKAPFMLSMEFFYLSWEFKCGASILTRAVAISAAHCVSPPDPRKTRLRAGSSIKTEGKIYLVRKIVLHRDYDPFNSASSNDIALLFVFEHFVFSARVKSIRLPNKEPTPGTKTIVTGWGEQNVNNPRKPSMILQKVMVPIVKWKTCRILYEKISDATPGVRFRITENMVCAGYPAGKADSCQGDSGGPLFFNSTLFGVVSWGWGCARRCTPGVYTNVFRYVTWIDQEILKDRLEPP